MPRPLPLPAGGVAGWVTGGGASIWFERFGRGPCVVLLHPGMASSDFWGGQVAALRRAGHEVVLIDGRGHGRSTLGGGTAGRGTIGYTAMAADVVRVMDRLHRRRCAVAGWSDGAIVGLVLAMRAPERVSRVFAFGANMDLGGVDPRGDASATFRRYGRLTAENYRRVAPDAAAYPALEAAVKAMWDREPAYSAAQLGRIRVPVTIVAGAHDEVIRRSHSLYLARAIPGAVLTMLPDASHFAPLQDPKRFNGALLTFLDAPPRPSARDGRPSATRRVLRAGSRSARTPS